MMSCLVFLTLVVAACYADIVFPDQFEEIQQQLQLQHQQQIRTGGSVNVLMSWPTMHSVQHTGFPLHFGNGGFQIVGPVPSATSTPNPQSPEGNKPSAISFDTFLPPRWKAHVANIISRGVTKFTLSLDQAIQNSSATLSNDNLLFSPVSLTATLAMVLLASGDKTFEEVAKILSLESGVDVSHHSEIVHQMYGQLLQESERKHMLNSNLPQSKFAFGIFVEDSYPIREEFRAASEKIYKSEVISLDFSHRSREAQTMVNDWISKRTNGKIKNMLNEPTSPHTKIIIASALYFTGEWAKHFGHRATKRRPFNIDPDQTVFVDMMANGGEFPFYEDKKLGLKIIGFPYKGNEMTMYVVLPNTPGRATLRQLKSRLSPETLDGLISKMVKRPCLIKYPRMTLSSNLHLRRALQALGLSTLFNPLTSNLKVLSSGQKFVTSQRPIFHDPVQHQTMVNHFGNESQPCYPCNENRRERRQSRSIEREFVQFLKSQKLPNFGVDDLRNSAGISNPELHTDDIIHSVEMSVNERGTEAAAATSVILNRGGNFKWFSANRPFLFFIRDDTTGIIWFWGTINRPMPFFDSM